VVVSVDNTAKVSADDGELGTLGHWGAQLTGTGGADILVDAQRIRSQGEGGDGQIRGASSAVGDWGKGLGVSESQAGEGGNGGEELHGGKEREEVVG
jgi:hypothetical protein